MNRWACQLLNRFVHPFRSIRKSGGRLERRSGGQRQSCRPMVETLEDRTMPSAAGLAILNSLHDTVIRAEAVKDYTRDGSLTRSDMIDIFGKAALEGTKILNATELTDLHTIVSDYGPWAFPPTSINWAATSSASTWPTSISREKRCSPRGSWRRAIQGLT